MLSVSLIKEILQSIHAVSVGYDIVIASLHLIQELEGRTNGKLIGLDNLMDDKEITEKLSQALQ
ncbi:ascorbate-specific phosphotransferase enzyme iib component (ascorbate-specific pts system eiib component) [Streptococcus pneumoniae]|nr:ascorbate-specific phosphotransferase enzyme iib component (ascorbate-specific pts system eiib component) [Streptococcus pneumoniae]